MDKKVKNKIEELYAVAQEENAPAVVVITHLLLAHCLKGSQNDFAKWCCQHSVGFKMSTTIEGGREVLPGEFPVLPDSGPINKWSN